MACDEGLAQRIREVMEELPGYVEKKMFGGVGYLLHGNMACGVNKDDLIIRVGPDQYVSSLEKPYTREFDLTGRPMKGWVVVTPEGCAEESDLQIWIQKGIAYALSLPAK